MLELGASHLRARGTTPTCERIDAGHSVLSARPQSRSGKMSCRGYKHEAPFGEAIPKYEKGAGGERHGGDFTTDIIQRRERVGPVSGTVDSSRAPTCSGNGKGISSSVKCDLAADNRFVRSRGMAKGPVPVPDSIGDRVGSCGSVLNSRLQLVRVCEGDVKTIVVLHS